jgi:hypothetical protein
MRAIGLSSTKIQVICSQFIYRNGLFFALLKRRP